MADLGQARLRDAMAPLPYIWAISPQGIPKKIFVGRNVNGGVMKLEDGELSLRKGAQRKGWRLMEPECSEDEWAIWTAYHAEADKVGGRIAPLPAKYWPQCCKGASEPGGPPVASFDADAVAKLAGSAAKSTKGPSTKSTGAKG